MFTILKLIFVIFATAQASPPYTNISADADSLTPSQGVLFENTKINDHFGNSVSKAGDFNADGYPDIVIGSKGANSSAGIVYVIFGNKDGPTDLTISSGLTSSQALIIYAPPSGSQQPQFGYAVSYAGDMNDDGIDDIMFSAYGHQNSRGLVYVIYGSKNLPPVIHLNAGISITQGFTILGASLADFLGGSLSYAGDVNNDQIDDIIIGATGVTDRAGAAYIIFGVKGTRPNIILTSSGLAPTEGFVVLGPTTWSSLGSSVSRGGDLNGDGIDDVIIGASAVNGYFGEAYVIFGSNRSTFATIDLSQGLGPTQGITLSSGTSSSYLGSFVTGIGDFNGDGNNDFLVSAYRQSASKGAVYVIFGGKGMTSVNVDSGLDSTKGFKIIGSKNGDQFGNAMSDAGDYNGDGLIDIVIGAPYASNSNGVAYVIFGSKEPASNINVADGLSSQQGFAFTSSLSYDYLGCAVGNMGDMNQDGMDDLLIATYRGMVRPGAAFLFYTPLVCPNTCLTCTKRSVCQTCKPGYGLVNSMCVSCPPSTSLVNGICKPSTTPLTTTTEVAQGLFNSGSTTSRIFTMGRSLSVGLGLIAKIIQNVRFLNISYPQEAQTAFESYGTDLFELPIPDIFYETPDTKSLPTQYSKYDISPTFVENYWQTIMTLLIIFLCILLIKFLQFITRNQKKEHIIQIALKNMNQTASNFLVIQIYSNLDDVIFFFLLDTSSTKLHSPSASFSLSLACCFLILGLALVFLHCWVLSQYQKAKHQGSLERFRAKFRILGTLFEDFKDDSLPKQSFFGILILRCVFLVLVIMLLQPPWIQASLLMLANLFFLAYLIYQRPFKNRFDEIMQYFCELTVFAAYLSVLVLSILDYKEDFTSSVRNGFGKCIVLAGIVLSLGGFIAQVIQTAGAIIEIYRFIKNYYRKSSIKISPTKLKVKPNQISNQEKNFESSSSLIMLKNNNSQAGDFDRFESIHTHHQSALISENSPEKLRRSMNDLQISSTNKILDNVETSKIALREDENMMIQSLKIQRSQTHQDPQPGQLDDMERINTSRKHKKFKRKQKLPDLQIHL